MDEVLTRMPEESVSMFTRPFGRWYAGVVYRYDQDAQVWRKVAEVPEDQLLPMQHTMLERTRAWMAKKERAKMAQTQTVNIEVTQGDAVVYTGPWQGAPEAVRKYIASAEQYHGADNLENYLRLKGTPIVLGMRGWGVRVL